METFNLTAAIRKYRTPSIQELKWKGNQTRLNGGKKKKGVHFYLFRGNERRDRKIDGESFYNLEEILRIFIRETVLKKYSLKRSITFFFKIEPNFLRKRLM